MSSRFFVVKTYYAGLKNQDPIFLACIAYIWFGGISRVFGSPHKFNVLYLCISLWVKSCSFTQLTPPRFSCIGVNLINRYYHCPVSLHQNLNVKHCLLCSGFTQLIGFTCQQVTKQKFKVNGWYGQTISNNFQHKQKLLSIRRPINRNNTPILHLKLLIHNQNVLIGSN